MDQPIFKSFACQYQEDLQIIVQNWIREFTSKDLQIVIDHCEYQVTAVYANGIISTHYLAVWYRVVVPD